MCLAAGLYYIQVLGDADADGDKHPSQGSYLQRFSLELDGRRPQSLAVWEHMACSFLRAAAGYDFPPHSATALSLLEKTPDWDLPFRSSMSYGYWRTRTRLGLCHEGAYDVMVRDVSSISDEIEAVKEYLAERRGKEDSSMEGGSAIDPNSQEEGEAIN